MFSPYLLLIFLKIFVIVLFREKFHSLVSLSRHYIGAIIELTSYSSCFIDITVFCCLILSVLKTSISYILFIPLVISFGRVNPVPVFPWMKAIIPWSTWIILETLFSFHQKDLQVHTLSEFNLCKPLNPFQYIIPFRFPPHSLEPHLQLRA